MASLLFLLFTTRKIRAGLGFFSFLYLKNKVDNKKSMIKNDTGNILLNLFPFIEKIINKTTHPIIVKNKIHINKPPLNSPDPFAGKFIDI
ncbi:hypothetical protein NHF50_00065 [Flavobacterium sp. NRK F10]|uniref:hypothetical protein n=1 Tax=Flavobacterium sp. NRK F10 TaxID=2954931 RepID=UPI0020914EB3|nr:hypothetical protein [Flavobacterium sp. NRK F10]MCO6173429.1 hypothetical protein [Flavobacterium sp. NRK F10]